MAGSAGSAGTEQPQASLLSNHSDRSLLVKILAELRVVSLLLSEMSGSTLDLGAVRNEVMSQGTATTTDL